MTVQSTLLANLPPSVLTPLDTVDGVVQLPSPTSIIVGQSIKVIINSDFLSMREIQLPSSYVPGTSDVSVNGVMLADGDTFDYIIVNNAIKINNSVELQLDDVVLVSFLIYTK
jgi:hypothetical protein